jgi:hypothetical protein
MEPTAMNRDLTARLSPLVAAVLLAGCSMIPTY